MSIEQTTHWHPREVSIWQAPLLPVALTWSLGIVLNHFLSIPLLVPIIAIPSLILVWTLLSFLRVNREWLLLCLLGCILVLGMGWHQFRAHELAVDDVSSLAQDQPIPVTLRGVLLENPRQLQRRAAKHYPVYDSPKLSPPWTLTTLRAESIGQRTEWTPVSGRVRVLIKGEDLPTFHVGETVEMIGLLKRPRTPSNPGETDYAKRDREQGIHCELIVLDGETGITRLEARSSTSISTLLSDLRAWGSDVLERSLPEEQRQLASAILLGRMDQLPPEKFDQFRQTGVVHVLVISGQHFMVLALFVQIALRLFRLRLRQRALFTSLFLIGYAFLVGLRPPVLRATVTFCALGMALLVRRRALFPNAFALAWIVITVINPNELFSTGCQLSFLAVAVLHWIVGPLFEREEEPDPLDQLIAESRPAWQQALIRIGRVVLIYYVTTFIVWLALVPLITARTHLMPIAGLLIGPPIMIGISLALITGFLLFFTSALIPPVAGAFAWMTKWLLMGCQNLIEGATEWPFSYQWVSEVPTWWLVGFYLLLTIAILAQLWPRHRPRILILTLLWLCLGLIPVGRRQPEDELRITFLDVGHGICVVMETPDGRVLVYDAGSIRNPGPSVGRARVAPFLWHRGIRRIDELFLSHADLDHYNGVPDLLERFAIGQVSCTPSFDQKESSEAQLTLKMIRAKGIPIRTLHAGNLLQAGDVTIEVLHPPKTGPPGKENARSLVLRVSHGPHQILLTGDVEGAGLKMAKPRLQQRVEILMAPHHGSLTVPREFKGMGVAPADLTKWTEPRVVISSQSVPKSTSTENPYLKSGARYLTTWKHGAITVRSHESGLVVETFRTKEKLVLHSHR